ncbi:MAG: hypothetical protein JOZ24_05170 [Candidatus Eremiobacteraeota bacterium]|nr:hypothetical protein [Candidatus Eremiobacteraeota bacterium]
MSRGLVRVSSSSPAPARIVAGGAAALVGGAFLAKAGAKLTMLRLALVALRVASRNWNTALLVAAIVIVCVSIVCAAFAIRARRGRVNAVIARHLRSEHLDSAIRRGR